MSQQINLLNPALIKQKDLLNPTNIAVTLALLVVLMLIYYGYAQKQLSMLTAQRNQVAGELSALQEQLKQSALLHTPREQNKAFIDQITQLEQKENMQQQVLQTINLSSATPEKGYAALMRAFAKQSVDGLWLTSFNINSKTEQLNISGRSLQAELVPEYIARLGNEPALKGKLFSALNMNLPKADASTTSKPSAASANLATTIAPTEAKFIEFSLQSIDDKSATDSASASSHVKDGNKS